MDISRFFSTTPYPLIVKACKKLADGKFSKGAVMLIADICSYNGGLPTGAPTSPYIGNIVLDSADRSISKACRRYGITYTRYADNITCSGDGNTIRIIPFITKVLKDHGFFLNQDVKRIDSLL